MGLAMPFFLAAARSFLLALIISADPASSSLAMLRRQESFWSMESVELAR
jgi:hypothetical protein